MSVVFVACLFSASVRAQNASGDKAIINELRSLPDGVLKVKSNPNGSFRSLVVKATVEIEDALGGDKGKRMARKEAEIQCRKELSQWLKQSCSFTETSDKMVTIITTSADVKDSAGTKVSLKAKAAEEVKTSTESYRAYSEACLRGLVVLATEVTSSKPPEYVLVMGLSQKSLAEVASAKQAISGDVKPNMPEAAAPAASEIVPVQKGSPAPEEKVAPDAKDYM